MHQKKYEDLHNKLIPSADVGGGHVTSGCVGADAVLCTLGADAEGSGARGV